MFFSFLRSSGACLKSSSFSEPIDPPVFRHGDALNVAFLDGHAEKISRVVYCARFLKLMTVERSMLKDEYKNL